MTPVGLGWANQSNGTTRDHLLSKKRSVFPNDEALTKILYLAIQNVNEKIYDAFGQLGFDNFTAGCYV